MYMAFLSKKIWTNRKMHKKDKKMTKYLGRL